MKMKQFWADLGGKLGVGMCGLGFLFVFLGWNGAASVDRVPSQFPYLISGGVAGLCFCVIGVGLLIVQNQRAEQAELRATIAELKSIVDGSAETDTEFALPVRRPTPEQYAVALRPHESADGAHVAAAADADAPPAGEEWEDWSDHTGEVDAVDAVDDTVESFTGAEPAGDADEIEPLEPAPALQPADDPTFESTPARARRRRAPLRADG